MSVWVRSGGGGGSGSTVIAWSQCRAAATPHHTTHYTSLLLGLCPGARSQLWTWTSERCGGRAPLYCYWPSRSRWPRTRETRRRAGARRRGRERKRRSRVWWRASASRRLKKRRRRRRRAAVRCVGCARTWRCTVWSRSRSRSSTSWGSIGRRTRREERCPRCRPCCWTSTARVDMLCRACWGTSRCWGLPMRTTTTSISRPRKWSRSLNAPTTRVSSGLCTYTVPRSNRSVIVIVTGSAGLTGSAVRELTCPAGRVKTKRLTVLTTSTLLVVTLSINLLISHSFLLRYFYDIIVDMTCYV